MYRDKREIILEIKDLRVEFGKGKNKTVAVDGVTFNIYRGETFGLVGESGSGKTTIGRAIARIIKTKGGDIIYKGRKINCRLNRKLRKEITGSIQMVFQDPSQSLNERAKIDYIVSEGLYNTKNFIDENHRKMKVEKALLDVGLSPEYRSRFPHEFSGGQRQRIGIARAIIMEPEFIILDEPTSALDISTRAQILKLLLNIQKKKNLTYLLITHDLSLVRYFADRVAVIRKGKIVELAETEKLFTNPTHPYTKSLISAIPVPDPNIERNKILYIYEP